MNGLARIVFAQAMDLTSFKLVYAVLLTVQLVTSVTLDFVAEIKPLFFIWVCVAMACEGGHFSLYSALCAKMFGKSQGGVMFSLLYYSFGVSSILGFILQLYLVKVPSIQAIGYISMFMILSVADAVSLILLLWRFQEKSPWLTAPDTEENNKLALNTLIRSKIDIEDDEI